MLDALTWNRATSNTKSRHIRAFLMVRKGITSYCVLTNQAIGFAVVGEYEDTQIKEAQKHAFDQMLSWLKAH